MESSREMMWLQWRSKEQTYDLRTLDVGGREGTQRAPRGQPQGRNSHAQLFFILPQLSPFSPWGLRLGSQLKGRKNERSKRGSQSHPSTRTKPMRGSKGLFSRHKRWKSKGGSGANEWKPANCFGGGSRRW